MARSKYEPRKMTQSAAVVKLRTYVKTSKFSVGMTTKCDPDSCLEYTNFTLRIGEGGWQSKAFSVTSNHSFDEAFEILDRKLEALGVTKGEIN